MKNDKKNLDADIADIITDKPHGFSVANQHFYLYPVTLGKVYLLSGLLQELNIDEGILRINPYLEAVRCATQHKETCCRMLAFHTARTKAKALDAEFIEKRTKFFMKELTTADLATILIMILSWDRTSEYMQQMGIDEKQKELRKAKIRGGKTIYGTLIYSACKAFGWSFDYVLWEISFMNLRLLLADAPTRVNDELVNEA